MIQNVVIGTLSTQTLNTSNFETANLVANASFTVETSRAIFNKGITVKAGEIRASNTHLHANNISIRNNLSVNGAIILRGSTINLGDGGDVVNLGATVNNSIIPTTTNTFNLGAPAQKYANVFVTNVKGLALPTNNTDAASKAYVDTQIAGFSTTADGQTLGSDFNNLNDGAKRFASDDNLVEALDNLNETTLNIFKNTYVRDVTFSADTTAGGAGTTVTLTLTVTGNANSFDINWGDGTTDSNVTDTTPSHTYTSNAGSPYTVQVTARNTGGTGSGSSASLTRSNFITIFLADPVPSFTIHDASSGGSVVTTAVTGTPVYLQNTTSNIPNTAITATFSVNWGDGSSIEGIDGKTENGGPQGGRLAHTYTNASGTGRHTVTLAANTFSAGNPAVLPLTTTALIKVFDASIASPNNLGTKTISLNTSSVGTNPRVASGFTTNGISGTNAGDNVTRYTTSGAIATAAMGSFFFQADGGTVTAFVDGSADGQKAITNANDEGTFTSLIIDDEQDYNSFDADGNTVAVNSRIYAPGLFEGYKARVSKSNFSTGLHSLQLQSTAVILTP